jgi:hypothetical protein
MAVRDDSNLHGNIHLLITDFLSRYIRASAEPFVHPDLRSVHRDVKQLFPNFATIQSDLLVYRLVLFNQFLLSLALSILRLLSNA